MSDAHKDLADKLGSLTVEAEPAAPRPLKKGAHGRFVRGTGKGGGRKPGVKNKVDRDAKELMDALVQHGLDHAIKHYDRLAQRAPGKALAVLARFAEYRLPKLARVENTGPNGGPQVIEKRIYVTASTEANKEK